VSWELSNLLRVIATTTVIWIHASYSWWFATNDDLSLASIDWNVFISTFINQAGRFTVPLFVILSGVGLAKSEQKHEFRLATFFRKRCLKILPAYILFTIVNLITRSEFRADHLLGKFQQFLKVIADGSADYHLYFLLIILKCYLCYPLLRLIRFSPQRLGILSFCLVSVIFLNWLKPLLNKFGMTVPDLAYLDPIVFWLPYFLIGTWIAREPKWLEWLVSRLTTIQWGWIWAIAATLTVGEYYMSASILGSAVLAGHFYRPTVVLLTLTFLLWTISWEGWLADSLKSFQRFMPGKILATFSGASFTTFLIHTHVLRRLTRLEFIGGVPYLIIAAIVSWILGISIWKILCYTKYRLYIK
jgi:probable poly-beta-1,6-N-acetyl-D-glucosamine export protein